ncbi:autotransporter domain-containing protein [Mesonia aestuariivivens]|uniref:Autotransporter outer membrane beta-barrel domain-containing protein n=1 Tax=Mesonia aestuariivivens TaxID=2796128 RepID=A0ABS6VXC1_9FLAO|nr:autotransporter domain-containing protein [Mesonia aestuariivivens]MBW2960245.1 autotransporter outer membrane beta-barrel domain-containing protein [Mesonia aestuariivivens]
MKKAYLLLSLLLATTFAKAQTEEFPKNEVKLNIANTIAIASVEVGYERFISFNQSVEVVGLINDRINYHSQSGSRDFNTNSIKLGYNYYFDLEQSGAGIYANPFLKYRFGDFSQDQSIGGQTINVETDMDAFMVGLGAGYKWNFNNKFVLGPFVNIARNFSDEVKDRFSAIEFNAGFNVGYRF